MLCVKGSSALHAIIAQEDSFKVDVADPRFAAVYTSQDFALDPTNPAFMFAPVNYLDVYV